MYTSYIKKTCTVFDCTDMYTCMYLSIYVSIYLSIYLYMVTPPPMNYRPSFCIVKTVVNQLFP